jgi:hypothetical protein
MIDGSGFLNFRYGSGSLQQRAKECILLLPVIVPPVQLNVHADGRLRRKPSVYPAQIQKSCGSAIPIRLAAQS